MICFYDRILNVCNFTFHIDMEKEKEFLLEIFSMTEKWTMWNLWIGALVTP